VYVTLLSADEVSWPPDPIDGSLSSAGGFCFVPVVTVVVVRFSVNFMSGLNTRMNPATSNKKDKKNELFQHWISFLFLNVRNQINFFPVSKFQNFQSLVSNQVSLSR
jgi:hypothetical protein